MHKILLLLLLIPMTGCNKPANEWIKVNQDDSAGFTSYTRPSDLVREGNLVKLWVLFDYKSAQSVVADKPFMSSTTQYEFMCDGKQNRRISVSWHSENMGRGDIVFSHSNPGKWEPIMYGTINAGLLEVACGTGK
jgi:hypothetical protein